MIISTIILTITGFGGGSGGSPPKDEGALKKWLDRLADVLKKLAGKVVEKLSDIMCFWRHFKFSWKGCWICY